MLTWFDIVNFTWHIHFINQQTVQATQQSDRLTVHVSCSTNRRDCLREIKAQNMNGVWLVCLSSNRRRCRHTLANRRQPVQQLGNLAGISVGAVVGFLRITKSECDPGQAANVGAFTYIIFHKLTTQLPHTHIPYTHRMYTTHWQTSAMMKWNTSLVTHSSSHIENCAQKIQKFREICGKSCAKNLKMLCTILHISGC